MLALDGWYVLINQRESSLSTVACDPAACVAAAGQCHTPQGGPASGRIPQRILSSGLLVLNCCGAHRRPAVDDTGEVNVLCAQCERGYAEMAGRCVACASVQFGRVFALLGARSCWFASSTSLWRGRTE